MGTQPTFTCPRLTMKHQNNMQNLFKVNNEDTRMTSLTSIWCCYFWLWTDFTHCSGVSIVDFEQVHADWVSNFPFKIKTETVYHGYPTKNPLSFDWFLFDKPANSQKLQYVANAFLGNFWKFLDQLFSRASLHGSFYYE